jgi:hypothetical protein
MRSGAQLKFSVLPWVCIRAEIFQELNDHLTLATELLTKGTKTIADQIACEMLHTDPGSGAFWSFFHFTFCGRGIEIYDSSFATYKIKETRLVRMH